MDTNEDEKDQDVANKSIIHTHTLSDGIYLTIYEVLNEDSRQYQAALEAMSDTCSSSAEGPLSDTIPGAIKSLMGGLWQQWVIATQDLIDKIAGP